MNCHQHCTGSPPWYWRGDHALVLVYRRPVRRWWRKQMVLRCWYCELEIREP